MRPLIVALCAVAAALGCAPAQSNANGDSLPLPAMADTLVGVVTEMGADPATWMAVRPSTGGAAVRLNGSTASALRGISGAEVWLAGVRQNDSFHVYVFEVRRANGQPVDDGTLRIAGSTVFIRMRSGVEREIPDAPPALRELSGARIWVTRPVAGRAPSYGLIQRTPGS